MKFNRKNKAFTLIEILIVIAIIGILAAVVIVVLAQASKEKARIAAGQQFADSLRAHAILEIFGNSKTGYWLNLDGSTSDEWSTNAVTLVGASNWVQGISGQALEFDGSSTWLSPNSPNPGFYHDSMTERTVEMWTNPDDVSTVQTLYEEGGNYNGFWFGIDADQLLCVARNGDMSRLDTVSTSFSDTGNWHHVACIFDGNLNKLFLYVDSELMDEATTGGVIGDHGSDPGIGASASGDAHLNGGSYYYDGLMDNFRVFAGGS